MAKTKLTKEYKTAKCKNEECQYKWQTASKLIMVNCPCCRKTVELEFNKKKKK